MIKPIVQKEINNDSKLLSEMESLNQYEFNNNPELLQIFEKANGDLCYPKGSLEIITLLKDFGSFTFNSSLHLTGNGLYFLIKNKVFKLKKVNPEINSYSIHKIISNFRSHKNKIIINLYKIDEYIQGSLFDIKDLYEYI